MLSSMRSTALLVIMGACTSTSQGGVDAEACRTPQPIAVPDRFTFTPEAEDPFRLNQGPDASVTSSTTRGRCGPLDVKKEDLGGVPSFSITTLFCSWGTVETRTLTQVPEGAPVSLRLWHFSHIKIGKAEAQIEMRVDGRTLWQTTVPLPTDGALITADFGAPFPIAEGARLLWHVSNHGQNSWNFLSLDKLEVPCPD